MSKNRPKLFDALITLTNDEWSSFGKFLLMYTRDNSDNYKLYKVLVKQKSQLTIEGIAEKINKKYFKTMSPKTFSNMLSRIFLWFEEWFSIEVFKKKDYEKELFLIKGYNRKGLFKLANSVSEKLQKEIQNKDYLHLDHNEVLHRLYRSQYFSSNPIKKARGSTLFNDCLKSHRNHIAEQVFLYMTEILNRGDLTKENTQDLNQLKRIFEHSEESPLKEILSSTLKMMESDEISDMIDLKDRLKNGKLDKSSDLYLALSFYLRYKSDKHVINRRAAAIDSIIEINNMIFEAYEKNPHIKILPTTLFNAVTFISEVSAYKDSNKFIREWAPKTSTSYPESTLQYCFAINSFRHEKFEALPELINGLQFDNYNYKVISGAQLVVAYYELNEEDLTLTLISNLKKQLKRNKKRLYPSVLNGLKNLMELITQLQKSKYDTKVKIDLELYKPLFFTFWAEKQIERRSTRSV